MPKKLTQNQRQDVLRMLAEGLDRETIAASVGVTPGQVSAISAHVKMGTYELPAPGEANIPVTASIPAPETTSNLLAQIRSLEPKTACKSNFSPILLGNDAETNEEVYWNPDPQSGSANPHVLVLGESGFGKTYTISCLLGELALKGIRSIVFDYGQGFSAESAPPEFLNWVCPLEIEASRDGLNINPLQIFPSDVLGPINVAQRVADTFARVYPKIGIQQHAVLREAVLDVMADVGIVSEDHSTWDRAPPAFGNLRNMLMGYAADLLNPQSRVAATVASHISTMFVFNTFRSTGRRMAWPEMLSSDRRCFVIQLKGLEYSLERAVTEFLLWNLIGFIEAMGPSPLQCFVVLDEAHKLSFDRGAPVEKLLREGRKFGLGLMLSSQQPEDFSPVAFANTSTKLVFQVGDERSAVSRQLHRKIKNAHAFGDVYQIITKLPRGCAYVVTENIGRVVAIASFQARLNRTH